MARPNKRSALAPLHRTRQLERAQGFELSVRTSDSKHEIVDAITHSRRASFERVLALVMREELKAMCRAHGHDDSGKLEQAIVDRILGKQDAPQLPGVFEDGDEVFEATGGAPTLASVLGLLRNAQLVSLDADYPIVLDGTQDEPPRVRLFVAAEGISLPQVLGRQGPFDMRKTCAHHGLTDAGSDRDEIIERFLAASPSHAPPSETSAPAMDAVLHAPATQAIIPRLHHVPAPPPAAPPSAAVTSSPRPGASAVPEPRELVLVGRQYLVDAVQPSTAPDAMTRVEPVRHADDNQGRKLAVRWELKLGRAALYAAIVPLERWLVSARVTKRVCSSFYRTHRIHTREANSGLIKTYNALKDAAVTDPPSVARRDLHVELGRDVLAAYGWSDIEVPPFEGPPEHLARQRLGDAVLDRLFALNRKRADGDQRLETSTHSRSTEAT